MRARPSSARMHLAHPSQRADHGITSCLPRVGAAADRCRPEKMKKWNALCPSRSTTLPAAQKANNSLTLEKRVYTVRESAQPRNQNLRSKNSLDLLAHSRAQLSCCSSPEQTGGRQRIARIRPSLCRRAGPERAGGLHAQALPPFGLPARGAVARPRSLAESKAKPRQKWQRHSTPGRHRAPRPTTT